MIIVEMRLVLDEAELPEDFRTEETARAYVAETLYEQGHVGVIGAVPLVNGGSGHLVAEMSEHQYDTDPAVLEALRTGRVAGVVQA